jgi:hypothetical protein
MVSAHFETLLPGRLTLEEGRLADRENQDCQATTALIPFVSLLTVSSTFDLLFKVLFTFPSLYFFAIGLPEIFSFG